MRVNSDPARGAFRQVRGAAVVSGAPAPNPQVDIVIPVYRGLEETQRCIDSVLQADRGVTAEVVVIDDASPDPSLVAWLRTREREITVLHNERNLGFVATVNRGMALHPDRDVVLLNSDTEVANNWLHRLRHAAYSGPRIGSVTPFSNNATICSYPQLCHDNPLPRDINTAQLDLLFRRVNAGVTVDIPTAVGFCMYIRRDCLDSCGLFDAALFGRGYGEENEFCMRSANKGWRHLLCADTFVYHKGAVSFAESQNVHRQAGHRALTELFPAYDRLIQEHIAADPAAHLRFAVDVARVRGRGRPVIVMVNHRRGGGTERHMRDLAAELHAVADVYVLRPVEDGGKASLGPLSDTAPAHLVFDPVGDFPLLLATLRVLNVARLHFHHTIGVHPQLLRLPQLLQVPYDVTTHDYYLACPQVTLVDARGRYCGAPDEAGCDRCLAARPAPGGVRIARWREIGAAMLNGAERVFVPSEDTRQRMSRYFPQARLYHVAHEQCAYPATAPPASLPAEGSLKIAVVGALSSFKGADTLEACAVDACRQKLPLSFHLLGFAYRPLTSHPASNLQIHGAYKEAELRGLLQRLQPDLVWFPGSCPETYSYVLSNCLAAGLPILATAIGAFPERLAGRSWTWLIEPDCATDALLPRLMDIRRQFIDGCVPVPPAGEMPVSEFRYARDYLAGTNVVTTPPPDWSQMITHWSKLGGSRYGVETGEGGYAFPNRTPTTHRQDAASPSIHTTHRRGPSPSPPPSPPREPTFAELYDLVHHVARMRARFSVDVYNWLEPDFAIFIPFVAPAADAEAFRSPAGARLMQLSPASEFLRAGHDRILATALARIPPGDLRPGSYLCAISVCFDSRLVGKLAKAAAAKRKAHAPSTLSAADRTLLRNHAVLRQFAHNRESLFAISFRVHITLSSTGVTDLRSATTPLVT